MRPPLPKLAQRSIQNACRDVIESALKLPGILDAGVALYDAEGVLQLDYVERRHNQHSPFAGLLLDTGSVTSRAARSGRTVCIHDCATNAPGSPETGIGDIDAIKAAPVVVDDQTIGAVVVTAAKRDALTLTHRVAVEALAAEFGLILSHRNQQAQHAHLQQLYDALNASNHMLVGSIRSAEKLYKQACQIFVEDAGFALAWITRPDKNGWFRTLAVAGPAQGVTDAIRVSVDTVRPEGHGGLGQAWRTGEAAYLQRPCIERYYRHWHAAFEAHGIHGIAAVPLKRNGRVDAVLAVGAHEPNYFGAQERQLFEEIGTDLSAALSRLEERIRTQITATAVQHAPTGVLVAEAGTQRVLYSNKAMERLTGYTRRELQCRTGLFFMPGDPIGRSLPGLAACIHAGRTWQGIVWGRRSGHVWEASVEVRTITGPDRTPHLLALFGPRPEAPEARLRDRLTGLPNAESFQQALATSLDEAAGRGLVVIRLNIHDMTSINGAYGHAGGDRVLVDLAGRLRQSLPMSTLVARLEGDNFALLTRAVRRDTLTRVAQRLLRRLEASVDQPFEIEGDAIPVMLATGVAYYPTDAQDAKELAARAETALGRTRTHDARLQVLTEDHPEATRARLATAARLRQALQTDACIHPWYQPKVDLYQGTLIGAEALARWQDEDQGLVSPGEFLPLTDAMGLTVELNRIMRDAVLRDLVAWQKTVGAVQPVAINLSAHQLTDVELPRQLLAALASNSNYGVEVSASCTPERSG